MKMHDALTEILGGGFVESMERVFRMVAWAEDEVAQAQKRHRNPRGHLVQRQHGEEVKVNAVQQRLWNSFSLLTPTLDLLQTEFVYRSHCRELLERVAAGEDTRPGTGAECCVAICEASQLAPLTTTASGLYLWLWERNFPHHPVADPETVLHYRGLKEPQMVEQEAWLRHKLARPNRKPGCEDDVARIDVAELQLKLEGVA